MGLTSGIGGMVNGFTVTGCRNHETPREDLHAGWRNAISIRLKPAENYCVAPSVILRLRKTFSKVATSISK
jgi:hypothetical protein